MINKTSKDNPEGSKKPAKTELLLTRPAGQARILTPEKQSQLVKLERLSDDDIDFSDDPETTEAEWATAVRGNPFTRPKKVATAVRLDADVVHWLKAQGRGYQTRLNAYLRRMMAEELHSATSPTRAGVPPQHR